MKAYCSSCLTKQTVTTPSVNISDHHTPRITGYCKKCRTRISSFVSEKDAVKFQRQGSSAFRGKAQITSLKKR